MKIFLSIILSILLLVPMTPGAAADETVGGVITVGSVTARAGDEILIPIYLTSNPGIVSMCLSVAYDSILTLTAVQDMDVLGNAVHSPEYTANPYQLFWNNPIATENYEVTGTVAVLTFKIADDAAEGNYTVAVSYGVYGIINVDAEEVPFTINNGAATVVHILVGDIDGDGVPATPRDAMVLERYIARWPGYDIQTYLDAADLDSDGIPATPRDAMTLARHIAGWPGYEILPIQ